MIFLLYETDTTTGLSRVTGLTDFKEVAKWFIDSNKNNNSRYVEEWEKEIHPTVPVNIYSEIGDF